MWSQNSASACTVSSTDRGDIVPWPLVFGPWHNSKNEWKKLKLRNYITIKHSRIAWGKGLHYIWHFSQGCRSLLSIGDIICNFTPISPYFSTLGRINLGNDFFQISKLSEDKKKVFTKNGRLFVPEFKWRPALRCRPESKYWGGCICRPYSNHWGDTIKLLGGDIFPIPPGFGTPNFSIILISSKIRVCRFQFFLRMPIYFCLKKFYDFFCSACLSSCHQIASDAKYWTIRALFFAKTTSWLEESVLA